MDLSIITVSWNVKDYLKESLEAVFRFVGDLDFEVFVVDNNSSDGTQEMLKQVLSSKYQAARDYSLSGATEGSAVEGFFDSPDGHRGRSGTNTLRVLLHNTNTGFARANNQAIQQAKGRYVLLLNPDMRVFPDTLEKMVKWMDEHPKVGVAGCRLVDDRDMTIPHVRRFPGLKDQVLITLKIPHLFPEVLDKYLMRNFDYSKEARVDSIRGSFFMIRREALKVGLLDERFFLWFEEVDFCKRMRSAGWEVWYTPVAKCMDRVGQSFALVNGYRKQKIFLESMGRYFGKWGDIRHRLVLSVARPIGLGLSWIGNLFKR